MQQLLGQELIKNMLGILGTLVYSHSILLNILQLGEGGIVISNDKKIIDKINILKAFRVNKSYLKRRVPGEYDANLLEFKLQ